MGYAFLLLDTVISEHIVQALNLPVFQEFPLTLCLPPIYIDTKKRKFFHSNFKKIKKKLFSYFLPSMKI